MARKIMVFDERISSYDEKIFETKPKESICFYCYKNKKIKYRIFNNIFLFPLQICDDCASIMYGGIVPYNSKNKIPHDPLLDYLNEIDPIEKTPIEEATK